jgi:hypothetical protein
MGRLPLPETQRMGRENCLISLCRPLCRSFRSVGKGLPWFVRLIICCQCRCNPEWTSLPGYSESFEDTCTTPQSCPCITRRSQPEPNAPTNTNGTMNERSSSAAVIPQKHVYIPSSPSQFSPSVPFPSTSRSPQPLNRITTRQANTPTSPARPQQPQHDTSHTASHGHSRSMSAAGVEPQYHHSHGPSLGQAETDTLMHRNALFERLVSGQESEIGEAPPAYGSLERSTDSMAR